MQWGAFSRAQALAEGLDAAEIDRRVRTQELVALRRGVYALASDLPDPESDPVGRHRAVCAARTLSLGGDVVVSHGSAAALLGWRLLDGPPAEPQVTRHRPPGVRPAKRRGVLEATVPPQDRQVFGTGLAMTTAARTLADCARVLPRDPAVVVADSALACGTSRAAALAVLDRCVRWPGARAARDLLLFADPRAESVLESLARQWFLEHGLLPPELQARLSRGGRLLGRVDFFWPDLRTVCEMDGRLKYDGPGRDGKAHPPLFAEKRREDAIRQAGAEVVRGYWSDGADRGAALVGRLHEAFERAAGRTDEPRYRWVATPVVELPARSV